VVVAVTVVVFVDMVEVTVVLVVAMVVVVAVLTVEVVEEVVSALENDTKNKQPARTMVANNKLLVVFIIEMSERKTNEIIS